MRWKLKPGYGVMINLFRWRILLYSPFSAEINLL